MDLVEAARSGHILSTYRLSELHSSLRTCGMTTIATRLTDAEQLHALCDEIEPRGGSKDWRATLASLATSEAALVRGSQGAPVHAQRFRPEPRLTSHVRHRSKYLDVAVPEAVAFVFTRDGLPVGARARTMRELAALIQTLDGVVLREHLQRGDVSRWISDVYRDETLAHRTRVLERLSGYEALSDLRRAIARLVEERYGLSDDSSSG
jgi:hypothetical protein